MVEAVARHGQSTAPGTGHSAAGSAPPSIYDGIRQNNIEVRIARTAAEIAAAQRLRYKIFYGEMNARPTAEVEAEGRDFDKFDAYCEHLLVLDHSEGLPEGEVIGTYRLLRRTLADRHDGFYTATEFDIAPLVAVPGEIMELGRACVDARFRNRPTMQLLWRGIASYVQFHDVKIMFGCASLPGTDPAALARPLSYLHYNHLAPAQIRARALPDRFVPTDILPSGEVDAEAAVAELDARATIAALPPLIKGYLRLGGFIGDGAVIDPEFQTTDVCIIVVTDMMAEKYFNHYIRTP
ncbi:ornithine-acyl ACP N-acyltransferase [Aliidongia dinghuensis]|uniref:L-ornithine N(alpha)-acyltransferase n=1 Tax=Aliidongia dinghuensis TaxID=1867774 RepID=A0A8J3E762_9PROT|nr:GNAT family N-acyltransferase [Aliidongia dinghuensis]GGF35595.1 ornithine-acyl ACP N-acyltransferase [Aliidongia dinghuensis]